MSKKERDLLDLIRRKGAIRIRDLVTHGIHPEYVRRLVQKKRLVRSSRGLYQLPEADISEFHDLSIVAKSIPKAIICLTSALRFHEIGTQMPRKIWLALPRGTAAPHLAFPPLQVVRFSGPAYFEGIEERMIEGGPIKVYNPAKTVADCFKFRNRIGLEAAIEAARECLRERKATSDDLYRYAKICRVWNVMRPYLEAIP